MSCSRELLAIAFESSTLYGILVTRVIFEWSALALSLGVVGIGGRWWWARRRAWNPRSGAENEAMRRHIRKNYD
jgi:hypothetical protein